MKKPYFLERQLPTLVREYMDSHQTITPDQAAQHLIDNATGFHGKKFKPLRNSVSKAIEWNLYLMQQEKEVEILDDDTEEPSSPNCSDAEVITNGVGDMEEILESQVETTKPKKGAALEREIENSILKKCKKSSLKLPNFIVKEYELEELAGIDHLLKPISSIMCSVVRKASPSISLLVQGPQGCGKTTIVLAMAKALRLPVHQIDMERILFAGPLSSPAKRIQEELAKAVSSSPCVVLMHQLDLLYSREGGWSNRQSEQIAVESCIINCMQGMETILNGAASSFLLVAETSKPELLRWKLKTNFETVLTVTAPSVEDKTNMLKMLCEDELSEDVELSAVALKASGFVAADLAKLVKQAKQLATHRTLDVQPTSFSDAISKMWLTSGDPYTVQLSTQDLMDSIQMVTPSLKKDGFPVIPDTTWQDIGGLHDVMESLRDHILMPIRHPDRYKAFGAITRSGTLLWGPPGCGKTLLAKAVANEAGINLLTVNGPELLSMYQGESEKAVREVFARAAAVAPCVIFFDEFDSLCPRRAKISSESGSKSTIVNMLLTEMDGFSSRSGIFVIAATNLPGLLDPAVLRPGRFDNKLYVGFPDHAGRSSVLSARTKYGTLPRLASDVNLNELAGRTECEHFTGADCSNLVSIAIKIALKEHENPVTDIQVVNLKDDTALPYKKRIRENDTDDLWSKKRKLTGDGVADGGGATPKYDGVLFNRHFEAALEKIKPSVSEEERLRYINLQRSFS